VAEVKYISHHAYGLIAGSTLAAIAIGALTLVLLVLVDATRFRRPQMWSAARPLVLAGGIALAVVSVGHQVVSAIETHSFAVGHDFSNHAVDNALTKGTANVITGLSRPAGGTGIRGWDDRGDGERLACRARPPLDGHPRHLHRHPDLVPLGGAQLEVVPAFWMVMMASSTPVAGRTASHPHGPPGRHVPGLRRQASGRQGAPERGSRRCRPPQRTLRLRRLDGVERLLAQAPAQARRAPLRDAEGVDMPVGEQLDRELAELLEVERFQAPPEFRERAGSPPPRSSRRSWRTATSPRVARWAM